jgi:hypothetical protein
MANPDLMRIRILTKVFCDAKLGKNLQLETNLIKKLLLDFDVQAQEEVSKDLFKREMLYFFLLF